LDLDRCKKPSPVFSAKVFPDPNVGFQKAYKCLRRQSIRHIVRHIAIAVSQSNAVPKKIQKKGPIGHMEIYHQDFIDYLQISGDISFVF